MSIIACAKMGLYLVIVPSFFHSSATVLGRSKTAMSGIPPIEAKCSHVVRTRVSAF
jgi:hypothetical protein